MPSCEPSHCSSTMVGIPGKSKGCTTCRRRKVRCDLGKPTCGNCKKGKRICEGYDRYPVFLNRTAQGYQKRERLEEVKLAPSSQAAVQDNAIAWFWDEYAPPLPVEQAKSSYASWLYYTMSKSVPSPVLRQALVALSVTRLGRVNGDDRIVMEGRVVYAHAVASLRKALNDKWIDDDVLATVRAMVLYENMESTSEDLSAWYMHLAGLSDLLLARGSHRHRTGLGKLVFEDVRYSLMLKAVMKQESSVFGNTEWKTAPWQEKKSTEQVLIDYGFDIASILERAERLRKAPPSKDSLGHALQVTDDCERVFDELDALHEVYFLVEPVHQWDAIEWRLLKSTMWAFQLSLIELIKPISGRVKAQVRVPARYTSGSELAQKLKNLVRVCMTSSAGRHRRNRALMPVYVLLFYFRHSKSEWDEVVEWKRQISTSVGQRMARNMVSELLVPLSMREDTGLIQGNRSK